MVILQKTLEQEPWTRNDFVIGHLAISQGGGPFVGTISVSASVLIMDVWGGLHVDPNIGVVTINFCLFYELFLYKLNLK